jgi:hypothetical protein
MFNMNEILEGPVTAPFKVRHRATGEVRDIDITYECTLMPEQNVRVKAISNLGERYSLGELGNKIYRANPHDQFRAINTEFTILADAVAKVTLGYAWKLAGSPQVN